MKAMTAINKQAQHPSAQGPILLGGHQLYLLGLTFLLGVTHTPRPSHQLLIT